MRILWFTNVPLAPLVESWGQTSSGSGFWMHALVAPLKGHRELDRLGVVYAGAGCRDESVEIDEVDYFSVSQSAVAQITGFGKTRDEDRSLRTIQKIIESFKPDLIHIHGTERFYGRMKVEQLTDIPVIVSIQGIMAEYAKYAWGELSLLEMIPMINAWEISRGFSTIRSKSSLIRRGKSEQEIIAAADGIAGRTDWDQSYCQSIRSDLKYFKIDEMLRPEFFKEKWVLAAANKHRIYTTARLSFLKGTHVFLEAVALLKRDYPCLEVRVAGGTSRSPESKHMMHLVDELGLGDTVTFLGWLPADQIVDELASARCYINTSFIENSSNSIQEAMLMGCPCIAAYTGGTPSLMKDRETGLLVPNGCAHMFAAAVRELFENEALCETIGANGRSVGLVRNDPDRILSQLIDAYQSVCKIIK